MKLASLIKKLNQPKSTGIIHLLNSFAQSRRKLLFPFLAVFVILQCVSCKDSGLVGTKMPGTNLEVTTDTFLVAGTQSVSLESFTGNRHYLSAGEFDDPLFGNIKATGLLLPVLIAHDTSYTFDQNTRMKLKLYIRTQSVYGDTTGDEQFKLVPIDQIWRGNERKVHEDIRLTSDSAVGSFTAGLQDSIIIPLSPGFMQDYLTYYNNTDSTSTDDYQNHFHGFALVPQNAEKIITINAAKSYFLMTGVKIQTDSNTVRDTLIIALKSAAYTLDRSDTLQASPNSVRISSTLENVMKLDVHLSLDNINPRNVSKAELIIHRNDQKLKASLTGAGPNLARPKNDTLYIYRASKDELLKSLDPINIDPSRIPRVAGIYNEDDQSYHFYLTGFLSWIINSSSDISLYLVPNINNGIIRENLLFGSRADSSVQPKIIVTHTNTK